MRWKKTETRRRGGRYRDFWARALHLLACSGTRHTHRLLPATPVVTLTHPSISLSLPTPSILSCFSLSRTRALLALPPCSSPLSSPSPAGIPSRVPLSRVPRPRRGRDARESIARGLRQGEHPRSLHSSLPFSVRFSLRTFAKSLSLGLLN